MDNDQLSVPCTMNLGQIEFSCDELNVIRAGDTIEFKKPRHFEAVLQIGGADWAYADVEIKDGTVLMRVKEIVAFSGNINTPEQETLSLNARY